MKKLIIKSIKALLGKHLANSGIRWLVYKRNYQTGRFSFFGIDKKLEELLPHNNG